MPLELAQPAVIVIRPVSKTAAARDTRPIRRESLPGPGAPGHLPAMANSGNVHGSRYNS